MKNKEETHNCGKISINNSKEKKKKMLNVNL